MRRDITKWSQQDTGTETSQTSHIEFMDSTCHNPKNSPAIERPALPLPLTRKKAEPEAA